VGSNEAGHEPRMYLLIERFPIGKNGRKLGKLLPEPLHLKVEVPEQHRKQSRRDEVKGLGSDRQTNDRKLNVFGSARFESDSQGSVCAGDKN